MSIEEIISQDLGFKLDTPEHGIDIFDNSIDLSLHRKEDLQLLSINHDLQMLAISNISQLKLVSLKNLEHYELIGDDVNITQVYFNRKKLLVVNSGRIEYVLLDHYSIGDSVNLEQYGHLDKVVTSILPSHCDTTFLALTTDQELYLCEANSSSLISSNVSSYCWKSDGSYIYALNTDVTTLSGKSIEFDTPPEETSHIVHISPFDNYLLVTYDNGEDFDHDIKSYVFEDKSDYYIPMEADYSPAFSSVSRKATYYTSTIHNWIESTSYDFITSSLATELSILSLSGHTLELIGYAEDIYRAQFPMNEETDDDCSPVGLAISYELEVEVNNPCPGVDSVKGKLPKVYVLLDTGKLLCYWVFHKHGLMNEEVSLERCIEYEKISEVKGETKVPEFIDETKAVNPFGMSTASAFKQTPAAGFGSQGFKQEGPSAFGSSRFKQESGDAFGSAGFKKDSTSALGNTGFGQATTTVAFTNQTATTPFAQKAESTPFGNQSFGKSQGPTSFGSTGFGQSSPFTTHGFGNVNKPVATVKTGVSSGFGKFATNETSGFGALGGSEKKDIFESSSPFAKLDQTSSPFAKLNQTTSPFGNQVESKSSPFAKVAEQSKNSPFGQLGKAQEKTTKTRHSIKETPKEKDKETNIEQSKPLKEDKEEKVQEQELRELIVEEREKKREEKPEVKSEVKSLETKPAVFSPIAFANNTQSIEKSEQTPAISSLAKLSLADIKTSPSPFAKLSPALSKTEVSETSEISDEEEDEESTEDEITEEVESTDIEKSIDMISHLKLKSQSNSRVELLKKEPLSKSKLALSNDILSTSEEEIDTPEEDNVPVEPVEFLIFDGLSRPLPKQSNVISDEISRLVAITQGNLSILKSNVELLDRFIQNHETTTNSDLNDIQRISQQELLNPTIEKATDSLYILKSDLAHQLNQVDDLSTQVQKCLYEKIKLDKLYSRLAILNHDDSKNQILKNRPLDIQNELMQINLREKLADVKKLESKLYSLIMPLKAMNSLNFETLNNTEKVIFQINCQIRNHRDSIDKLEQEINKLEVKGEDKHIELPSGVKSTSPRLKLRQRLRQSQPSSRLVIF